MKKSNTKTSTKKEKKRTYSKYSYALKRKIVNDILKGILSKEEAMLRYGIRSRQSINYWLSKYSLLNYRKQKNYPMKESPHDKIKRLETEIELLKEDKIILNIAIDIADEQLGTQIRKKFLPQQLSDFKKHKNFLKEGK